MVPDVVITGAGGFIGGHLTQALLGEGKAVRAVDTKPLDEWYQVHADAENLTRDLSTIEACREILDDSASEVYHFAANMGGMGFIENNRAACMLSVLSDSHMLLAARDADVGAFFYASSACVYPGDRQRDTEAVPLREPEAYPADPEDGYGWEKLFGERMARHFREDYALRTHVARYHNVYGPHCTWRGGREKAPAALSRKVAVSVLTGAKEIEVWGDGEQSRTFLYIDDCLSGTLRLVRSGYVDPVNLGSEELVTINGLLDMLEEIAGVRLTRRYVPDAPQGVRGRSSDNTLARAVLGWEPSVPLRQGMEETYRWVYDQAAATIGRHSSLATA